MKDAERGRNSNFTPTGLENKETDRAGLALLYLTLMFNIVLSPVVSGLFSCLKVDTLSGNNVEESPTMVRE